MNSLNDLRKILRTNGILGVNGKSTSTLLAIWNEDYRYIEGITVRIIPINNKHPEDVIAYISISEDLIDISRSDLHLYTVFFEDYFLRMLNPLFSELNNTYANENKANNLIGKIYCQNSDCRITEKSGFLYNDNKKAFILKLRIVFPIGGSGVILGARMSRMITDVLKLINNAINSIDSELLEVNLNCYKNQIDIREYLEKNELVSFVADGSILPRSGGSEEPLRSAIPFCSPETLRITVPLKNGNSISGMGIKTGMTVITGAAFSGKTTLLDAISEGIYQHILGDGREYVITDKSAIVTNSEDGRYISDVDISPFFKKIPNKNVYDFSTNDASGSVSQAANIIEAISADSSLIIIDEDKSATNFMIQDDTIRSIIENEVIVPFTDRIVNIIESNVSIIMVVGGSSEYLPYSDRILIMNEYNPKDITDHVKSTYFTDIQIKREPINWMGKRYIRSNCNDSDILFQSINTEKLKKIIVGNYSADVTSIKSLKTEYQLNSLAYLVQTVLSTTEIGADNLIEISSIDVKSLLSNMKDESEMWGIKYRDKWFEEVRTYDLYSCLNRLFGCKFIIQ